MNVTGDKLRNLYEASYFSSLSRLFTRVFPCELFIVRRSLHGRFYGGASRRRKSHFSFSPGAVISEVGSFFSRLASLSPPAALSLSLYRQEGAFLDSEVLDWVAREIIELCGSPLELITVKDAIWLAETPVNDLPPDLRSQLREAHFAAIVFDGPQRAGHFYLLIHRGLKSPLVIYESHPTVNGAHRRSTRAFRNILGAPSVETHTIFDGHDADCGLQTARHLSYALTGKTFFSSRQDFVEWTDSRLQARRTDGGSASRGVSFSPTETNKVVCIPGRACRTYAHGGFFPDPVPIYAAARRS